MIKSSRLKSYSNKVLWEFYTKPFCSISWRDTHKLVGITCVIVLRHHYYIYVIASDPMVCAPCLNLHICEYKKLLDNILSADQIKIQILFFAIFLKTNGKMRKLWKQNWQMSFETKCLLKINVYFFVKFVEQRWHSFSN